MAVGRDLRFLDQAVDSVLGQEYADLELVIVDDATRRGDVFEAIARRDPRILVLTNHQNVGAAASANRGIAASRGEIIARLRRGRRRRAGARGPARRRPGRRHPGWVSSAAQ